ncbi:hypothetical protein MLD38_025230 [Melastoma candidum]|uniref:Uncharacterized protein n=1 Tax=Melastoma candidum TaxID=119954 RepID=A0ACB9NY77_9MYRT|nr:hypothetical protein MLD38_025230 [Melastoma candidum]
MEAEDPPIPVDFFISRKFAGLSRGELGLANSSGNIVYKVKAHPELRTIKLVLDVAGRPVCSILQCQGGFWQVFWLHGDDEKDLICDVKITRSSFTRRELEVVMNPGNSDLLPLKIKGFPFQKSCTIYGSDSVIAQTSFMYKLKQIYVRRNKYRLTIFPGFSDHVLLIALVVIFFYGKK